MEHNDKVYKLFFGSLASPNRLKIIRYLKQGPKCVSDIIKATGFEQTMVSHNLKRLEKCGMVFAEQKGKHRYYTLNSETIKPLINLIEAHTKKYCIHVIKGVR